VLTGTTNVSTTGIKLPILQPGQTGQVIITANKRGTGVGTGIYVNQFVINDPKTLDSTPIS